MSNAPLVSVVVPVKGDADALARLLGLLPPFEDGEIVVSSTDRDEPELAALKASRPEVRWVSGPAGRGSQLNRGAAEARGRWLWFLHADSTPGPGWREAIGALDDAPEVVGGCFAFRLDSPAWQARVIEWGVGWRVRLFGLPYGDQGLFVRREVFEAMGGFAPMPLMEDVEFVRRLNRRGPVAHLTQTLTTSARRWECDGWWRRTARNLVTLSLYGMGVSPERLLRRYDRPK